MLVAVALMAAEGDTSKVGVRAGVSVEVGSSVGVGVRGV